MQALPALQELSFAPALGVFARVDASQPLEGEGTVLAAAALAAGDSVGIRAATVP